MKTRTFHGLFRPALAGLAVAAAVSLLLLGLAACDGDTKKAATRTRNTTSRTPNTTSNNSSSNMRGEDLWLLQNPDLPTTPQKLFSRLKEAAQAGDLKKMSKHLDPVTRKMVRLREKRALETLQKDYESGVITRDRYHLLRQKITSSPLPDDYLDFAFMEAEDPVYVTDTHCTVLLYRPAAGGTRKTMTIHMVKDGSFWRLDVQTEMRLAYSRTEKTPTP